MQTEIKTKRKSVSLISKVNLNIKRTREEAGMTQLELETNTQLKIYKYESGTKEMTLTTLEIIANALNIEPYKLLK
jgi:transcriptional regulator with XRE-family HTH domain